MLRKCVCVSVFGGGRRGKLLRGTFKKVKMSIIKSYFTEYHPYHQLNVDTDQLQSYSNIGQSNDNKWWNKQSHFIKS